MYKKELESFMKNLFDNFILLSNKRIYAKKMYNQYWN